MEETHQLMLTFGYIERFLQLEFHHRIFGETGIPLAADKTFLASALAEQELKHQANDGQKSQNQNPCQRLQRVTVIQDYDHNGRYDSQQEQQAHYRRENMIEHSPH